MRNNSPAPVAVASRSRPQSTRRAIVIGCGIAGPVVALALQRAGFAAEIHEARAEPGDDEGVFLNVVANGMQVLRAIGIHDRIAAAGFRFAGIAFHDERGRPIGTIDYGDQERDYGAAGIVIKRGRLQSGLRQAAAEAGVSIAFGRRLVAIADEPGRVVARFADGSLSEGDILVGCDGINSATRRLVFPDAPRPVFTGLYGYGGFSRGHGLPKGERFMHMYFGRRAFFGYATAPDDEVFWFGNVDGPGAGDTLAGGDARLQAIELHEGDPDPVPPIVRATAGAVGWYPIHEMPPLATWHAGRVVLVGDAAHAMSPHVGQGASLAMEDALMLAKCLSEADQPEAAFRRYHRLRHRRVGRIGRAARRSGNRKVPGPLGRLVRNLFLPLFLRLGERSSREAFAYRINWDGAASPADPLRQATPIGTELLR